MDWWGLDIGGANLKLADGQGAAHCVPFPLWRTPEALPAALAALLESVPGAAGLAVTMTGELADCFVTKAEGVHAILAAVEQVAAGRLVSVYLCDGRGVAPEEARAAPLAASASNWHVLAQFASRFCPTESGLLIDIGSTTTDLIPLSPSGPQTRGQTDPERLASGELIYTGVRRSPVCAVCRELPWRGAPCRVAQELFATTLDAYLLLGELPEAPGRSDTADGRPSTRAFAHARLARAVCADTTLFSRAEAEQAAAAIQAAQRASIVTAARQALGDCLPATLIVSGEGEFLARQVAQELAPGAALVALGARLGPEVSHAACAHALAVLAAEGGSR
jgi:probable H4MPT-linked C1 transfer pathway protein